MPSHSVLELHVLEVTEDAWCPVCLSSSAVEVRWVGADQVSLVVVVRGTTLFCDGCGFDHVDP